MPPRHILIADDDRHLRESLCEVMDGIGWRSTAVGDGNHAIACLERDRFDLLLSDVDMPDMTGFQLLGWVREHRHPEPVALMSARAAPSLADEARRLGAVTLLAKPVAPRDLDSLVLRLFPNH